MSAPSHADDAGDDQPVEVQDVLNVPDDDVDAPSEPSDQPAFPDFNS